MILNPRIPQIHRIHCRSAHWHIICRNRLRWRHCSLRVELTSLSNYSAKLLKVPVPRRCRAAYWKMVGDVSRRLCPLRWSAVVSGCDRSGLISASLCPVRKKEGELVKFDGSMQHMALIHRTLAIAKSDWSLTVVAKLKLSPSTIG